MVDVYGFSCRYAVHTWILGVKNRNFASRFACRVSRFEGILRKVYRYIHQTTRWGTERCIVYFISSLLYACMYCIYISAYVCVNCIQMYPPQPHICIEKFRVGVVSVVSKTSILGILEFDLSIKTYLEPQWPLCLKVTPLNKAFSNQNKSHLGSRYVYNINLFLGMLRRYNCSPIIWTKWLDAQLGAGIKYLLYIFTPTWGDDPIWL